MKRLLLVLSLLPLTCFSQIIGEANGGEVLFNPDNLACISEEAKAKINAEVEVNVAKLIKQGKLSIKKAGLASPTFIWPVQKAATSDFNDVWAISNYVDHDATFPDNVQDYNCGTRTYDTSSGYNHSGTDIFTWPFSWYQMENDLAEVVAAAAGTIVYKNDGEFDESCTANSNTWNAIYIQHSDGSRTWYGHLKNGSLTTKEDGDTVVAGEFLGIIGSSGNSTGPHLHFEVYDSGSNLIDPFNGTCNNITTWWQDQPDYNDPNINAVLTHSAPPEFNTCPETETTNLQNKFLPNSDIYMAGYLKDQLAGTTIYVRLFKPDGSNIQWSLALTNTYTTSYWYWDLNNLSELGTYKLRMTYEGQSVDHEFEVASTLGIEDEKLAQISVAPNPFEDELKISGFTFDQADYNMAVFNQLGQKVVEKEVFSDRLDLQFLSKGLYFLNIGDKTTGSSKSFKIVKK
ncbi:peptidoglycan DD-metalloendopeptidase family protein [Aureibaculum sp. A20]|uniref:Peptidoglycan DD-metalloendopeptidase family protein n=1 Tax=Aureibaculum flavum TaxID=2795986 RepID=A0ABS0WQR7_9FLAO|nr:peptidoglycan DD-metalloendopeptidase family protein [Aureibaculum flavum]MBJ2174324.1 peptidoglycan DD-metalloendopeptidase family protein [Aureibaculum flavum]